MPHFQKLPMERSDLGLAKKTVSAQAPAQPGAGNKKGADSAPFLEIPIRDQVPRQEEGRYFWPVALAPLIAVPEPPQTQATTLWPGAVTALVQAPDP